MNFNREALTQNKCVLCDDENDTYNIHNNVSDSVECVCKKCLVIIFDMKESEYMKEREKYNKMLHEWNTDVIKYMY